MTEGERQAYLDALDDKLLKGGAILSEWCSLVVRHVDIAFVNGAHLAVILTAVSAIETYLRSEQSPNGKERLVELIDHADIDRPLKLDLHTLRKYRNRWVHVDNPWDDDELLSSPEAAEDELERMALFALHTLRRTIYNSQWI